MDAQFQHTGPFSAYVEGERRSASARVEAHNGPIERRAHEGRTD
ncbi:hypothetical protein [Allobranchiibius sp. CTAmp26]|nr:hypothetical protein [Allobranchiibius sp. CTAmp26]